MRYLIFVCACMVFALPVNLQAQTIFFEDFEDSTVGYTTSSPDDLSAIAASDYFGRIAPDTASPPVDVSYSNLQGSGYYGVQDTDGTPSGDTLITLDVAGIDISDYIDLNLSFFIAEDAATDGFADWDTSSSFRVAAQIDNGGFMTLFAVESELGTDGNDTNELPRVDTDLDGVGDGVFILDAFQQFALVVANGSNLDLRFTFEDLNSGDEDLALDSIRLTGTFVGVPEPGSCTLLLGVGLMGLARRRR